MGGCTPRASTVQLVFLDIGRDRQQSLEKTVVVARKRHRLPAGFVVKDQSGAHWLRAQMHLAFHAHKWQMQR